MRSSRIPIATTISVATAMLAFSACASQVSPSVTPVGRASATPLAVASAPPSAQPTAMPTESPPASTTPSATTPSPAVPTTAWIDAQSMAKARSGHTETLLKDGTVLVAGDTNSGRTAETYDPVSGAWAATGLMVRSRTAFSATRLPDGRVFVVGGDSSGQRNAELYDPATRTWAATGIPVENRNRHTATLLTNGRVLLAGGNQASADSRPSAELYDPATGKFTATGRLLKARAGHTATLLRDGRVLMAGGHHNASRTYLATAEIYDPTTGTWTATGAMIEPTVFDTATLLPDGKVLVAGAVSGTNEQPQVTASAQLYDPVSGTWTATGPMNGARALHTATLLRDGRVLVTGGTGSHVGAANSILASAELYDPGSGLWTVIASMDELRVAHTATLLLDGRVLVAGGTRNENADGVLDTAELYPLGS